MISAHKDNGDEHRSDHLSESGEEDYNLINARDELSKEEK
jgi:hypothetical protein